MLIQKLEISDIPSLESIVREIYPDYIDDYLPILLGDLNDTWSNASVKPQFYVCIVDGKIVGFIGYIQTVMSFNVYNLYWAMVTPAMQNRGYGRALVSFIINKLKELEARSVFLSTPKPDYFSKFGFNKIDTIGESEFVMSLKF